MKTQFSIFMLIVTLFIMIQPTNTVDPNCLTFIDSVCNACNNGY